MIGDAADFVRRVRAILPKGWFGDVSPVTEPLLSAFGNAWQAIYSLITAVVSQTRISTASGPFLDFISSDFFGQTLLRRTAEEDDDFRTRIAAELFRPRATRVALEQALTQLSGRLPLIVEPARAADTGGYNTGGIGYGVAGAWGNLMLSHCCFVTAFRLQGNGIANVAGYGTGGPPDYASIGMMSTPVDDSMIYAAAANVLPLGSIAWIRIVN